MMFSIMVVGAGAAFSDQDKIENKEAVDVCSALNIINGYPEGDFKPDGDVTRAHMCKMICVALNGGKDKNYGTSEKSNFSDVAADNWAAPYIDYCVNAGIVAGFGDGTFKPTNNVTATQAAKMLLVALGYKAENEGYLGANWAINVNVDASDAGLYQGIEDIDTTAALNRDNAAQMIFNLLKGTMVKYANAGSTIVLPDGTTITNGSKAEEVTAAKDSSKNDKVSYTGTPGDGFVQFCEKFFPNLKMTGEDADSFGRPVNHKWTLGKNQNDKNPAVVYTDNMKPVAVFPIKTSAKDVEKALNGYTFVDNADKNHKVNDSKEAFTIALDTYKLNGADVNSTGEISVKDTSSVAEQVSTWTLNNRAMEVYANSDNEIVGLVYVEYTPEVVNDVKTDKKTGDVTYTLSVSNQRVDYADQTKADTVVLTAPVEKGDQVVTAYDQSVVYVYPTTAVTGVIEKKSDDTVTVNGTTYNLTDAQSAVVKGYDFTSEYTFYLDMNNVVVASKLEKAVLDYDYAYVKSYQAQDKDNDNLYNPNAKSVKAEMTFTDGTTKVVDLAIYKDKKNNDKLTVNLPVATEFDTVVKDTSTKKKEVNNWLRYSVDKDGKYTLAALDSETAAVATTGTLSANKGTAVVTGKYNDSKTVITVIDADGKVTTTTGLPAKDTTLAQTNNQILVTYAKDSNVITNIYAVNQAAPKAEADVAYAYAVKAGNTVKDGTEWVFSVDGKQDTYVVAENVTVTPDTVYNLTLTDGIVTAAAVEAMEATNATVTVIDSNYIVAGAQSYELAANYQVFDVSADASVVGEVTKLAKDQTVNINTVSDNGKTVVDVIYVTANK